MQNLSVLQSERPRNVNVFQAASLLYGDWGTSKAYVIGLAFFLAAHSSFWLILAVSLLNILVGLNYILICKYYPNGGGVYASVRNRSEILALLGGFFLVCDYIITASLSALSALSYVGVAWPELWAMGAVAIIGILNYFGPRHTGNLAFTIAISTFVVVCVLGFLSLFHIKDAIHFTTSLTGDFSTNWHDFVGVIVALSGVEAIANMTGVMKLDPGSTPAKPSVVKTSTPAILAVMLEVSFFTALFGLVINALPYLTITSETIDAPGNPNVRDYMLRYMGQSFCAEQFGLQTCEYFALVISIVFGILLLSAVNTAIVALNSLLFVMAKDGQLPKLFNKTNAFGVPTVPLLLATLSPILVLVFVNDIEHMANLYAIGFVGAIATNLGSTSTNKKLDLKTHERILMFVTFIIMCAIEVTLFIQKAPARVFIITVIAIGLLLRALVIEQKERRKQLRPPARLGDTKLKIVETVAPPPSYTSPLESMAAVASKQFTVKDVDHLHRGPILCVVNHIGKTLEFALEESKNSKQKLYVLFIRERMIFNQENTLTHWLEDDDACKIFDFVLQFFNEPNFTFLYDISDSPVINIVEHAKRLKVSRVILGMSRHNKLLQIIRGDIASEVFKHLPSDIDLIIVS